MISFGSLTSTSRLVPSARPAGHPAELAMVILCRTARQCGKAQEVVDRIRALSLPVEVVVVTEPAMPGERWPSGCAAQLAQGGAHAIEAAVPCGLASVRFNEGILASRGKWVWLVESIEVLGEVDVRRMLQALREQPDEALLVRVHPSDAPQFFSIAGVKLPWVDFLFKGMTFPLENILLSRALFDRFGLLEPHIAAASFWLPEYLHRLCRHIRFAKLEDPTAREGVRTVRHPSLLHHWVDIDRRALLRPDRIAAYELDDLDQFRTRLPRAEAWKAYLEFVLPFIYTYRTCLPAGIPRLPQSFPPVTRHFLCLKGNDYETLVDVGFRNFDWFAQGARYFKSSYRHVSSLDGLETASHDAAVLIRTVDGPSLELARRETNGGIAVGYALDDDLLNFYKYGDGFAEFRSGHPAYDTMVKTIEQADVVLCSNPHIERSVHAYNLRTVHYEGSVLPEFLRSKAEPPPPRSPFVFGYAGGGYRSAEMRMIWPAIERLCAEYGDGVRFEFWGMESSDLPASPAQVSCKPFSQSYYEYLGRLMSSGFSAMLVPLLSEPEPRRGKAPNKLYESAVAGAIGIYSDVPTYEVVKTNGLGLMAAEDAGSWYEAMRRMVEMSPEAIARLRGRCAAFVRLHYTTPAMLPVHESSSSAVLFHGATRGKRDGKGRPVVAYVFPVIHGTGGGEITFRRRMELARTAGIAPLVIVPESFAGTPEFDRFKAYLGSLEIDLDLAAFRSFVVTPPNVDFLPTPYEEQSVREALARHPVALVHSGGYIPALGKVCSELGIPHVVAHYGVDDRFRWETEGGRLPFRQCDLVHSDTLRYARRWADLFGCEWVCARDVVPRKLFELGFDRLFGGGRLREPGERARIGVVGTLMERKSQLETIRAAGLLLKAGRRICLNLYGGLAAHPAYVDRCRQAVGDLGIQEHVCFKGHVAELDRVYAQTDILVSASTFESLPTAIKEATAAGCLVVTSRAGGITEVIKDKINGLVMDAVDPDHIAAALMGALDLSEDDDLRVRQNAHAMAVDEFHERRGLADLMLIYNRALELGKQSSAETVAGRSLKVAPAAAAPVEGPQRPPQGYARIGGGLRYRVVPGHGNWCGLDVLLLTHGRAVHGSLILRLHARGGQQLREARVDLANARHEEWLRFDFPPISSSAGTTFTLSFCTRGSRRCDVIGLFESNPVEGFFWRALRRLKLPLRGNTLHCRLLYAP